MSRTWRLDVPDPGCGYLNANDRYHWRLRALRTAAWRDAAAWYAKAAGLPMLDRAHILAVVRFRDARRRDPANWAPTVKACIDGIIGTARMLLPDDDANHLDGPDIRQGAQLAKGQPLRVEFTITELAP